MGVTGFEELTDGVILVEALAADPHRRAGEPAPGWSDLAPHVIDRGAYAIFPLAAAPASDSDHVSEAQRSLRELDRRIAMHCIHFYGGDGFHAETSLDTDEGYGRRLAESGVAVLGNSYAWRVRDHAAILVRSIDPSLALETLAFHVVPSEWVWYHAVNGGTKREASRFRRAGRERDLADASWGWPTATGAGSAGL